ncbi:hypothetical protein PCASD_12217 [Puccinia coronata f. sp. avenae]|uniref:Uncharacterized protein n=1 Tax=Puccinia coronata f. sp. avenae TaxID=200324 RepID=A0A2N5TAR8_9BASI|nr:hypothetical protein PCASD_12217 [Puccinia coronata f. sp. avenae]
MPTKDAHVNAPGGTPDQMGDCVERLAQDFARVDGILTTMCIETSGTSTPITERTRPWERIVPLEPRNLIIWLAWNP